MQKKYCYVIAQDFDTQVRRPARVKKSDAKSIGSHPYNTIEDCQHAISLNLTSSDVPNFDAQCTKCKLKHFEKARVPVKKGQFTEMCCPACNSSVYYVLDENGKIKKTL